MTKFPVFQAIKIENYGLFPGTESAPGLDKNLSKGLTLVIGANGLGKTTLVRIIYSLLVGPYQIPGLSVGGELGNLNIRTSQLARPSQKLFADRVTDNAQSAVAALTFKLGESKIRVVRKLSDLKLLELWIDNEEYEADEKGYQGSIKESVGVWDFADWILLLHYLIFSFEDRRALVWDTSAQRQIFRFLFLDPKTAQEWTRLERKILVADSDIRNTTATLGRLERSLTKSKTKQDSASDVRARLSAIQKIQEKSVDKIESLQDQIDDLEQRRQDSRLRLLRAEEEYESRYRELERVKGTSKNSVFAGV